MSEILEYSCPCCGGAITFDAASQKMKCPYCDTEFEVDTLKEFAKESGEDRNPSWEEETVERTREEFSPGDGLVSYVCESCGGEILGDESMAASRCPYCDNPVIVKKQLSGALRPDLVIPFKLDKKAAVERLRGHLMGKLLLPNAFKTENKLQELKGVYVPFWLYDCDAQADIRCRGTRIRVWRRGDREYTETSHYLVSRSGKIGFDAVPVDGSRKMADDLMESIEPFRYQDAVEFQNGYLAGYLADRYDLSSGECAGRANERIRESTEKAFLDTIHGYEICEPWHTDIRLERGKITYALLPVWILHTRYRGKLYTFAMNGQTGKFVGDLPADKRKAVLAGLAGFLLGAVLAGLVTMLF
ncbi:MAG TPA: hypothetical protein IAB31_05720 [Candidatus Choladousia intestinavium]|uniref:DNA-directed RNA polymerase subunit P n=1 Tax=Candidatus Choladousia intestinavium TaxID=2840727 RepID=A0A9D1ABN5_9FIRM|nr:hypothetical protein [Candidatus Choladousia intestinavium]